MSKKGIAFGITVILCITVCLTTLCACGGEKKPQDVVPELINQTESVSLTQRSYYPDYARLSRRLAQMQTAVANGSLSDEALACEVEAARRELEQLGYYYDYEGKTSVTAEDGSVYGACSASGLPLGGGEGYPCEYGEDGTKVVYNDSDFYYYVLNARAGDVIYLLSDLDIDLSDFRITDLPDLVIPEGITVASGRGVDGEGGAILRMNAEWEKLFAAASDVRITGLVIEGPDPNTGGRSIETNGMILNGTGIVIDNCEISGFSGAGIIVEGGDVTVKNCYIHHIRGENGGNGILVKGGSATVEESIFANCRNAVRVENGASAEIRNGVEVGNSLESFCRIAEGASVKLVNNTVLGYTVPTVFEGESTEFKAEYNLFSLNEHQYGLEAEGFENNAFNIKAPYASTDGKKQETLLCAPEVTARPAAEVDYGEVYLPDIVTVGGVSRGYEVMKELDTLVANIGKYDSERVQKLLRSAFSELGCFSAYYEPKTVISTEIDGVMYGAYVTEGQDPIGGGVGYSEIFTTGDYVVDTLEELVAAAEAAKSGEIIFVEGHAFIDVSSVMTINIGAGVTLASDRGCVDGEGNCSAGAVLYSSPNYYQPVIATGDGARISGIVIAGYDTEAHMDHYKRSYNETIKMLYGFETSFYSLPMQDGICPGNDTRIDNCEIFGFGHAGIHIKVGIKGIRVDHCYIHHNQTHGLGYGVCHNDGTESVIEYCLFNYNRHSIQATGAPTTGYIARFNVDMGNCNSHCFDMHGGYDRKDGTEIAGTYCEMYNNTFLARNQYPYLLRGVPEDYQIFYRNVCAADFARYDIVKLQNERATLYDNIFNGELIP